MSTSQPLRIQTERGSLYEGRKICGLQFVDEENAEWVCSLDYKHFGVHEAWAAHAIGDLHEGGLRGTLENHEDGRRHQSLVDAATNYLVWASIDLETSKRITGTGEAVWIRPLWWKTYPTRKMTDNLHRLILEESEMGQYLGKCEGRDPGSSWYCSLPMWHDGDHEAYQDHASDNPSKFCARWPNEKPNKSLEERHRVLVDLCQEIISYCIVAGAQSPQISALRDHLVEQEF